MSSMVRSHCTIRQKTDFGFDMLEYKNNNVNNQAIRLTNIENENCVLFPMAFVYFMTLCQNSLHRIIWNRKRYKMLTVSTA